MGDKILLIGCGHMGGLLLNQWKAQASLEQIVVVQPSLSKQKQFQSIDQIAFVQSAKAVPEDFVPTIIVLAFKPQHIDELKHFTHYLDQALVISLLAGIKIERLLTYCPPSTAIVRVMPNLAMQVGQSVNLMCATGQLSETLRQKAQQLFVPTGELIWLESEKMMDLLTPIVSSGLAYFFLLSHYLEQAVVELGIEPKQARSLIQQTLVGSAYTARQLSSLSFVELIEQIASKKGVTEAALAVLRQGMQPLVKQALNAALERTEQLSQ